MDAKISLQIQKSRPNRVPGCQGVAVRLSLLLFSSRQPSSHQWYFLSNYFLTCYSNWTVGLTLKSVSTAEDSCYKVLPSGVDHCRSHVAGAVTAYLQGVKAHVWENHWGQMSNCRWIWLHGLRVERHTWPQEIVWVSRVEVACSWKVYFLPTAFPGPCGQSWVLNW